MSTDKKKTVCSTRSAKLGNVIEEYSNITAKGLLRSGNENGGLNLGEFGESWKSQLAYLLPWTQCPVASREMHTRFSGLKVRGGKFGIKSFH